MRKLKVMLLLIVSFSLSLFIIACSEGNSNTSIDGTGANNESTVEFVEIPGDGADILPFKLGKTEVTNQQYVDFLNSAMSENLITVVDEGATVMMIYDNEGNQISNILGTRVIKDHDRDGVYDLGGSVTEWTSWYLWL